MQRTAPLGGLSRDGTLLQLYRDSRTVQRLYETACLPSVLNRPCRFVNQSLFNSVCVQKYTYMYAIVKDYNITQPYRVDYIRVKSACSCQIIGKQTYGFSITNEDVFLWYLIPWHFIVQHNFCLNELDCLFCMMNQKEIAILD